MREADFLNVHFDLEVAPFSAPPDPAFLYWSDGHKRAWSMLEYSLLSGAPLTLLTGGPGTGKTLLLRHVLEAFEGGLTLGLVSQVQGSWQDLLPWVLQAFGLEVEGPETQVRQFDRLQSYLIDEYSAGRRVVLMFDEAQNLSNEALEELRMLTNINAGPDCLLQIVLCGQTEVRDRLAQPQMALLAQRITVACQVGPMSETEVQGYIRHRVEVAGGETALFAEAAMARIGSVSGGVPRLVNQLSDLAMLYAFGEDVEMVQAEHVMAALEENALFALQPPSDPRSVNGELRSAP